jgi:hypothetical protein
MQGAEEIAATLVIATAAILPAVVSQHQIHRWSDAESLWEFVFHCHALTSFL